MRTERPDRKVTAPTKAVRAADPLWYCGYGAYFLFHAVSLYTTTYGIGVVMQVERIGWVAPLLLGLAVQAMIGVSGHRLRDAWRQGRFVVGASSTTVLLICVSISAGFAYAFWWHLLLSQSVARDVALAQSDRITQPVQAFAYRFTVAAADLDRLASYSAERAATERDAGGTCEAAIGGGPGPRTRLREADYATFTSLAERFRGTAETAEAAVGQLQDLRENYDPDLTEHDRHTAAVNRILHRVRPLVTTGHESTIDELEARIARGRAELVDYQSGERYRCHDPHLEDLVRRVAGALRQLQDVGNEVPAEISFHRPDHHTSLAIAYEQLAALLKPADEASPAPEAADAVPLLFALAVDVVIFMLPLLLPANREGDGDHRDYVGEIKKAVESEPLVPGAVIQRLLRFAFNEDESRNLYDLLNAFRVERGRFDEVALPFEPETLESSAARRLMQVLGRRPHVRLLPVTPRLRCELRLGDEVEFVTLYRLEPEFMVALAIERVRQSSEPSEDVSSRHGPVEVAS